MKKQWISLCLAALLALPLAACASEEAQPSPAPSIAPESSAAPENSAGPEEESTPEPAQTPVPMDALDTGYQPRSFTEEEADIMRQYLNDHELLDYERPLLAGGTAKLSDYEGKVTVINLMATWCGWCVKELPDFAEAAALYGDAVNFLAVNTFEKAGAEEELRTMLEEAGITYDVMLDADNQLGAYLSPSQSLPVTMIVDEKGIGRFYLPGAVSSVQDLTDPIDFLLQYPQ